MLESTCSDRILTAVRARQMPPVDPSILKLYFADSHVQTGNLGMRDRRRQRPAAGEAE